MTKPPLKIVFAGTPEFAAVSLRALLDENNEVVMVYTQPDRPAGRGRQLQPSAVKQVAQEHQLPLRQPVSLRDETEQQFLRDLQADVMIVVAYGLILPEPVLIAPRLGCINAHASLLPRWRGAAPIQHAILAGDQQSGISIMQMDEGLDTGPVILELPCPINDRDTSQILHDKLAELGAQGLLMVLADFHSGIVKSQVQTGQTTYAAKINKQQALIDWQHSAPLLDRTIRAFNPNPIAYTHLNQAPLRIWEAIPLSEEHTTAAPGTIIRIDKTGIDVATGQGILRLLKLQFPGGKPMPIADLLNSKKTLFNVGTQLN